MKKIERIAILGSGMMGHGIAQVFLGYPGYQVTMSDRDQNTLDLAPGKIENNLKALGLPPVDLSRLRLTTSKDDAVADADIVIESITENIELKQQLFVEVEKAAPAHCIFASNTSVIPITAIGEKLKDKTRMIGNHWWNPPYMIPLVEVVQTVHTSPEVIKANMELLAAVGKKPVHVKKDVPGFVANRLQHALWREAIYMVEVGICDAAAVDQCIQNSFGLRISALAPLENTDMVGLEMVQDIHRNILADLCTAKAPSPLLQKMIDENKRGWSTNLGFYEWTDESKAALRKRFLERIALNLAAVKKEEDLQK
jgi:3-hydroxybutyryl-CoA dehydrogenase